MTFSEIDAAREPETDASWGLAGWATVTTLKGPGETSWPDIEDLIDQFAAT